jgi:hypothetical protein
MLLQIMKLGKRRSKPKIISDEQFEENVKAHDVVSVFCILLIKQTHDRRERNN